MDTRSEIVRLAKQAGFARLRVEEIESGCLPSRVRQIIAGQMNGQAGTLTLSDPDAAGQAEMLAAQLFLTEV